MRRSPSWLVVLICLTAAPAGAFESDQLTRRAQPLTDGLAVADAHANVLLQLAADRTNERLACQADPEVTRRVLARQVFGVMGRSTWVPARGELPPMEFGAYGAWMESGPIDRRTFTARDDLYSGVRPTERPILALWGPASTVRLGDTLVGTDKIDHFWVQGWLYWRHSRRGEDEERAVAWGTRTELQIWGQATTGVFSWGDLAANHRGFEFYSGLLGPDSPLQRDVDGCVVLARGFTWDEWADERFDEVLNPSSYRRALRDDLSSYLARNRERLCAELPSWADDAVDSLRAELLAGSAEYVSQAAPPREDPFALQALCADVPMDADPTGALWRDGGAPPWRFVRHGPPRRR